MKEPKHIYTLAEAALAYALCAERICGVEPAFLNANRAAIPILVNHLFQSLEISIKHAGIDSELFTMQEARARERRSGHGIKELAALAVEKLGGDPFGPIVTAMTYFNANKQSGQIVKLMICGEEFESTRECFASRRLGYGEISDGEFALVKHVPTWIEAIKQTALNLQSTVEILRQWKASPSKSKHFAIWLKNH